MTLLYPFTDTAQLFEKRIDEVAAILGAFSAFEFLLDSIAYFATAPRVLYLQPSPDIAFRAMTGTLVAAFPEHPPYEGDHHDPTPHATVAVADDQTLAVIEQKIRPSLPITARATDAALLEHDDVQNVWRIRRSFPLA